ncbi:unnamed protein product [Sphagnum balticum]
MYQRKYSDFVNAGVSVAALATLTLLTAPFTTCFYPHIAGSIVKTVPLSSHRRIHRENGGFVGDFADFRHLCL